MAAPSSVLILVSIDDRESREHILDLLHEDRLPAPASPFDAIHVEESLLEQVDERVRRHQRSSRTAAVILISDGLVDEQDFQHSSTPAARELLEGFVDSLLTTVAVMQHPVRVSDIERSVSRKPDTDEFAAALDRCLRKLAYLHKPGVARNADPARYSIRVLRFEDELLKYFRFRHEVYALMCYLDAAAEDAPSGLEIDWFDKSSVHVGVYYREQGFERLVGTGRLIATRRIPGTVPDIVSRLAARDPVLRAELENAVGLQLPVLQSHGFVDRVERMLDLEVVVGEVSRVIVAPEHRGMGLSHRITSELIRLATNAGLSDLLLECLPIHTPIYQKSGFQLVPNASGRVYKIGRTMDVMALPLDDPSISLSWLARARR